MQTAGKENLGCWTDKNSTVTWSVKSAKLASFTVEATVSAEAPGGSEVEVVCGDQAVPLTIPTTKSWNDYGEVKAAGTLKLPAGASTIQLRVKTLKGIAPCNLASLRLVPEA